MNISPKVAMWLNIVVAILGFVAAGALPSFIPAGIAKDIAEAAGWLVGVYGAVNAALHGYSAPQAGPLVKSQ